MEFGSGLEIQTTEMHTGGEPVRIVEKGYPEIKGNSILEKRRYAKENLDHFRKLLMFEPRGHYDMYGVLPVTPTVPDAHLAVLFTHNEGYSTMCGHAVIALGRYAVDRGLVTQPQSPETEVRVQCPCGVVTAFVEYDEQTRQTGRVRFLSVPAFAFKLDVHVSVPGYGSVTLDVAYGGAFYAVVAGSQLGVDVTSTPTAEVVRAAAAVKAAVAAAVPLSHPDDPDLAFLYGVIITDGRDDAEDAPTVNTCVFAENEVDRSPCGSGVTARMAIQYARKQIQLGQAKVFRSGSTSSQFTAKAVTPTVCGDLPAVMVEVAGRAHYTGRAQYTVEEDDPLRHGFLLQ